MVNRTNATEIARKFTETCLERGIPVSEAFLFGSFAKGNATINSDIDLALIADSFGKNIIVNTKQTALINYMFPDVEVHHFNTEEFNSDDPFINEIKRTGIKVL